MTDEDMEQTEPAVAEMLDADGVDEATFESNNGGRGFSRNVERLLEERDNRRCAVKAVPQTPDKEARILASSAWVNRHIFMPRGWKSRWPAFHKQLHAYQKKGKNKHDDAPTSWRPIYERVANPSRSEFRGAHGVGQAATPSPAPLWSSPAGGLERLIRLTRGCVPSLSGLLSTRPSRLTGPGCPQLLPLRCDGTAAQASHPRTDHSASWRTVSHLRSNQQRLTAHRVVAEGVLNVGAACSFSEW